jgi:hypothetical protein
MCKLVKKSWRGDNPVRTYSGQGGFIVEKLNQGSRTIYWSDREGFNWFVTGQKTEKQLANIFNLVSHQS